MYRLIDFKIMSGLSFEIERAKKQGDRRAAAFTGAVRSLENLALEEGDEWTFPEEYEVFEQKLGDNYIQYIFIEVNGNAKKFYPSTFTKVRAVFNEDGTATGQRVFTQGTAAELFRTATGVQEGMDKLKGKKVKVSKITTVRTLRYNSTSLMNALIPTIDIVE